MLKRNFIILFITITIFSCDSLLNKDQQREIVEVNIPNEEIITEDIEDTLEREVAEPEEIVPNEINYDLNIIPDQIEIVSLSNRLSPNKHYGIVANKTAYLYNKIDLINNKSLENLEKAIPVNIGTILELQKTVEIQDTILETYFKFNGDYNYFYETTYDNSVYLVWGADLKRDFNDTKSIVKYSHYYTNDLNDKYYDFNGKYNLTNGVKESLSRNYVAFEEAELQSVIDNYKNDLTENTSLFITTDLLLNSLHYINNSFKNDILNSVVAPSLKLLLYDLINEINSKIEDNNDESSIYGNTLFNTRDYLLVALTLLDDSHDFTTDEYVIQELKLIENSLTSSKSPILKKDVDYNFTNLTATQKALKWLMYYTPSVEDNILLFKLLNQDKDRSDLWSLIKDELIFTFGESSSLDFSNSENFRDSYILEIFDSWVNEDGNISAFIQENNLQGSYYSFFAPPIKKEFKTEVDTLGYLETLGSKSGKSLKSQYLKNNDIETNNYVLSDIINTDSIESWMLKLTSPLFSLEQNRDYFFTLKGVWNKRILLGAASNIVKAMEPFPQTTSFSSVEEIFSKESVPTDLTFKIEPVASPKHFVEPNLNFIVSYIDTVNNLSDKFNFYFNEDVNTNNHFKDLKNISLRLKDIITKEIEGTKLSEGDIDYISKLPTELGKFNKGNLAFTSSNNVTISKPKRVYIALDNDIYGKAILTGYINSYTEFDENGNLKDIFWTK